MLIISGFHLYRAEALLGELQFAFACFFVGQVWDGWEHWQRLLTTICSAEELLLKKHEIYLKLLSLIHFQIQEVSVTGFLIASSMKGRISH